MKWGKGSKTAAPDSPAASKVSANSNQPQRALPAEAEKPDATAAPAIDAAVAKSVGTAAQQAQFAQLFSQAVAVLMRDANFKNLPLKDLEFLLPPIMVGHCAIANAQTGEKGPFVPVALALWAKVSPAVDKRLSENLDLPIELKPNEWTSGSIPWLITLAGSTRAFPTFVKQLCENQFNGQQVKMRGADRSGKRSVQIVTASKMPT